MRRATRAAAQQLERRRAALRAIYWSMRYFASERRNDEMQYRRDKMYRSAALHWGHASGCISMAAAVGAISEQEEKRLVLRCRRIWNAKITRDGLSWMTRRFNRRTG